MDYLSSFLLNILPFIFVLGAAVVIHEFGHFAVAKLLKMRVEVFSVGFGPRLFGFRRGTTDYRLSLIPLGGYVKLGGDESNAAVEGATASDIPENERFDLRPRWQKFLVIIAGPVMNILTALAVVFFAALMNGVPATPTLIVRSVGAQSAAAGLRTGDRIVAFNGENDPAWERIRNDSLLSPDQPLPMTVERNGERIELTIRPTRRMENDEALGVLDFMPDFGERPVIITSVVDGTPASEAGLRAGDRLLAINNEPMRDPAQVTDYVESHRADPMSLSVDRAGERLEINIGTRRTSEGRLGITQVADIPFVPVGIWGAAQQAVKRNIEIIRLTGNALGQVFTGQRAARDTIAGPIGIARATSTAARDYGWAGIFSILGFLSLNLGIVNLLPIPVLDGGAIMMLGIEGLLGLAGINLSMAIRERIQQVGFVVLILLMGFAITNDILKTASRWRGSPANDNQPTASPTP